MAQQQQQQQPRGAGGLGAGGLGALGGLGAGAGAGAAGGGLDALRNSDAMANLRQRVIENPALLQHAVQAVAQQNPQVAEYLNANPELLLQMLSGQMGDLEGDEGDAPEGVQTISLTQEEMDAIERVSKLFHHRD
jgi:UV excision repair protein RAD23